MFNLRRPLGCSWDQIWPIGALRGPWGPPKGLFGAKSSPFKAPWGPEGARYQVKVCGDHKFNPIRPFEGSCDKIWPTGALLEPPKSPKGPFWAKTSPFRAPLGPKGARDQVKVCCDHESNPGGLIGGSWDQICLPWALRGPPGPQKGPFGAQTNPFCLFSGAGWFHMGYNSAE